MNIRQPPLLVKEAIGSFEIDLSINATAFKDIIIQATMAGIIASGNKLILLVNPYDLLILIVGSDFSHAGSSTQLTSPVSIASGQTSGSMNINIIDDTVQEYNETFNIAFTLQQECLDINLIGENSFNITIIDDEGYLIFR